MQKNTIEVDYFIHGTTMVTEKILFTPVHLFHKNVWYKAYYTYVRCKALVLAVPISTLKPESTYYNICSIPATLTAEAQSQVSVNQSAFRGDNGEISLYLHLSI